MPKGPKGERRPADVIGNAIRVARLVTSEDTENFETGPRSTKRGFLRRETKSHAPPRPFEM